MDGPRRGKQSGDVTRGTPELRQTPCFDIDAVRGLLESPRLEIPYATHPPRLAHAPVRGGDLGISPGTGCAANTGRPGTSNNSNIARRGRVGVFCSATCGRWNDLGRGATASRGPTSSRFTEPTGARDSTATYGATCPATEHSTSTAASRDGRCAVE
jgi:hypothetical protein